MRDALGKSARGERPTRRPGKLFVRGQDHGSGRGKAGQREDPSNGVMGVLGDDQRADHRKCDRPDERHNCAPDGLRRQEPPQMLGQHQDGQGYAGDGQPGTDPAQPPRAPSGHGAEYAGVAEGTGSGLE